MGRLIPVGCFEVLPGDTVQQATSALVRVSPLMAPVMHPVSVRIHHWFVPHRLVWDGWEQFITGGEDGLGGSAGAYPALSLPEGVPEGSLLDYLGCPSGPNTAGITVSALPLRSFWKIYNEFYRDQDLEPGGIGEDINAIPPLVKWEKDYFTAARPWPQKGPDVSMPLGIEAPVVPNGAVPTWTVSGTVTKIGASGTANTAAWVDSPNFSLGQAEWANPGLKADLTQASAVNVNDVRRAFAIQRYQEARAQYGSRYTEYLRYLGVRSSDARLQRPEYLGGGKQTISFSEVLQTAPGKTEGDPTVGGGVGSMAGHGISAMRSRRYRRFFEEHGVVISLLSVRPRSMYTDGLPRMWSRRAKEDYWQRELEQIGQQEVYRREVYAEPDAAGQGGDTIFGYQDRYAEYKHIPSMVHGEFRSVLNYWHLGRSFASPPALNTSFVACDPSKRIFAEQTTHSLWMMVNNNIQARRMVRTGSGSRIL